MVIAMNSTLLIANDGKRDRYLTETELEDGESVLITFSECIESVTNSMQYVAVEKINNDIAEHAQAETRWLLKQAFKLRTGQKFPQFVSLVFRYLPMWRKSDYSKHYEYGPNEWKTLHKYITPYKRECSTDYTERVIAKYLHIVKDLIIVFTVERRHTKWVTTAVIDYFKLDAKSKKIHVAKCTRLFRGKIRSMYNDNVVHTLRLI